jgi:molybdenum cofactor synthesis domain-containing protein
MEKSNIKTAGLIIIGDEVLSGRTKDTNTPTIALALGEIGVQLAEVRIIADNIDVIVDTVRHFSSVFDYVFTTGGIGPTHDDKTAEAVAKAFNTKLHQHPDALAALINHYGGEEHMNDGRVKMTYVPQGASLIDNPVSAAPGFKINNVHVMAGVPKIMEGMLHNIIPTLEGGDIIKSRQIIVYRAESEIAAILAKVETDFEDVQIGSYPKYNTVSKSSEVTVIIRGTNIVTVDAAYNALNALFKHL